jgi:hypothetical protein
MSGGRASSVPSSNKSFDGLPSSQHLTSPACSPSIRFGAVFEDPIAGCLAVAVRDDHSPVVMLGFLLIFGCIHGGNSTMLECCSLPLRLHPENSNV